MPHAANRAEKKEVTLVVPNPLAIGVTLAGLLLELLAPRPKPRIGSPTQLALLSEHAGSRTTRERVFEEHDGPAVASGFVR